MAKVFAITITMIIIINIITIIITIHYGCQKSMVYFSFRILPRPVAGTSKYTSFAMFQVEG